MPAVVVSAIKRRVRPPARCRNSHQFRIVEQQEPVTDLDLAPRRYMRAVSPVVHDLAPPGHLKGGDKTIVHRV